MAETPAAKNLGIPDAFPDLTEAIDRYYRNLASTLGATHVPVPIGLILFRKMPDVSLFLPAPGVHVYRVFRRQGLYMSQAEVDVLIDNGVPELFIQRADVPKFTQYVEALLGEQTATSPMADEAKVNVLRQSAVQVMADMFEAPTPENIQRGVKVVSQFVYLIMRDAKAYQLLLSLSSHDHYTLQHSVGVATNAIILAKRSGVDDEASLIEVGVGGLLHDIGKTKIPKEIINSTRALNEDQWNVMKQHSLYGYEILKDNPNVGTRAKLAVLEHHEDPAGGGYPMGLSGSQISLFARIVTISDIYNALTTDRPYSKAMAPFDAFRTMKEKLSHRLDPKLFELMVLLYGQKL